MGESHLVFPGRYENLEAITEFVAHAAREAGLDETAVFHCQVAVDEACTNIIMHGYGGEGLGAIECTCRAESGQLTIVLEDAGRPFDARKISGPDLSGSLEQLEVGGLGMHLMRQMMDEVVFQPGYGHNRLVLVKRTTTEES